ncbi:MAG: hypothetical protein Q4B42_05220 [Oscillospiraceae bacterium]|nr:hypothetical protein [Oscillospiraceae bacterium]
MKEIPFLKVGAFYGGNQYWMLRPMMRLGGCSTVCACHAAALLAARGDGREALCPFEGLECTRREFRAFFRTMFEYVYPSEMGMPELSLFKEAFGAYAESRDCEVNFELVEGSEPLERAAEAAERALSEGFSPQFLLLRHKDKDIDDIEWHWFSITGFEREGGDMLLAFSTWGERRTISLSKLWDTGLEERGGLLIAR